ncbi:hypothetical protein PACILC2_10780 [Paenibacillus cisolokensis]|jgi:hypothetical protein|uniref:Uncharacterized protein n=1 Tax=Paenibacillus cisolokensis TaxID=1658519 RepID=A0ABQ4N2W9_9BACL|nr:hypothetical protein [Paenibacillus cisolokensis]GIQ62510.1 hypothetical protein PACILC2_10780 [Paenibacillus cisolokensis]
MKRMAVLLMVVVSLLFSATAYAEIDPYDDPKYNIKACIAHLNKDIARVKNDIKTFEKNKTKYKKQLEISIKELEGLMKLKAYYVERLYA